MACIRIRRGRPTIDYRDAWGRRRWLSFAPTDEGRAEAERALERIKASGGVSIDPGITLAEYVAGYWLPVVRQRVDHGTAVGYERNVRAHFPAALMRARVREIRRPVLKRWIATLGADHGLHESTVSKVAGIMRNVFEAAIDDGLVDANPATGIGRALGLRHHYQENVRAMDARQLDVFMAVAREREPSSFPALAILGYAGLRIGELRGLQLDDLDLERRTLHVERQVHDDQGRESLVGPVKGRKGRRRPRSIVIGDDLAAVLVPALVARREYDLKTGRRSPWLVWADWPAEPRRADVVRDTTELRRAMARALKAARLPDHFTPHCLRHSFARLALEAGESLLWVSRQLGHASIAITADRYGQWAQVPSIRAGKSALDGKAGGALP